MSVIVKGMEMPKRCLDCPFMVSRDNDDCILQTEVENELARTWEELKASCPLIELHPHGRLGDLDELEKQFKRAIETYLPKDPTRHMNIVDGSECRGWTQALKAVQEAETVIEAEY